VDRHDVERWVEGYERVWRTAGTDGLAELFAADASYLVSPWARPVEGLAAITELWEAERDGPDEDFTMGSDVVAVDGDTAWCVSPSTTASRS
jgi:ketosteroid isomerase-like protein